MGGLHWGTIFSTDVRTYLKGNILFLQFYLGSVYTMCKIVNPMMYDSMLHDYLKVICTKWAKYFRIYHWELTHWAHNSRGECYKEGTERKLQTAFVSCAWPKKNCTGPALVRFPCFMAPMLPSSGGTGWRLGCFDLESLFTSLCVTPLCAGKEGALSLCPGSAPFTEACLKRQKSLKGKLCQLPWVIVPWRAEVGWYRILRAIQHEIWSI